MQLSSGSNYTNSLALEKSPGIVFGSQGYLLHSYYESHLNNLRPILAHDEPFTTLKIRFANLWSKSGRC